MRRFGSCRATPTSPRWRGGRGAVSGRSRAPGPSRSNAVVPLAEERLYVLAVWPRVESASGLLRPGVPSFAFPVLMWAASLLVALVAADIRCCATSAHCARRSFASPTAAAHCPGSISRRHRPNCATWARPMTHGRERDPRRGGTGGHDPPKEVLLREVHHRVKNNLQLIASIINMQIRKAESPEAKLLMRGLQDRVMSLATIHRELYQTSGVTDIRADELLSRIVRQVVKMARAPVCRSRSRPASMTFASRPTSRCRCRCC